MPADETGRHRIGDRRRIARSLEDREHGAVRVGDDGKAPNARDIIRRPMNLAALGGDLGGGRIDIVDADITEPGRGYLHFERTFRHRHQSGNRQLADIEQRVAHAGHAGIAGIPADDVLIEGLRRGHVRRHQFIPNKFAVICHCLPPVCLARRISCRLVACSNGPTSERVEAGRGREPGTVARPAVNPGAGIPPSSCLSSFRPAPALAPSASAGSDRGAL
ncbi:hypothetical protein D9M70_398860 [compost metagenome]